MRLISTVLCLACVSTLVALADDTPPLTPAEAAKKVNEKVVVQMEVKSTGGNNNLYLNSEEDFKDEKNFTIFIAKAVLEKFRKAGIEDPDSYYSKKVIQVTGKVVLENKKPWIKVEEPDQIKVVKKEEK